MWAGSTPGVFFVDVFAPPEIAFLSISLVLYSAKEEFKKRFPAKVDQNEPFLPAGTTNASSRCGVAVRLN